MEWLNDSYTIVAGDVAALFASRGYSTLRGQWETCAGTSLVVRGGQLAPKHRLCSIDFRVQHSTGAIASGVRVWIASIIDPQNTGFPLPIVEGVQSVAHLVGWHGAQDMGAGVAWRVARGGLVAGDIVSITVGYRRAAHG